MGAWLAPVDLPQAAPSPSLRARAPWGEELAQTLSPLEAALGLADPSGARLAMRYADPAQGRQRTARLDEQGRLQAVVMTCLTSCAGQPGERLSQLQTQLRCGTECGSCLPALKALVSRQIPVGPDHEAAEAVAAARAS